MKFSIYSYGMLSQILINPSKLHHHAGIITKFCNHFKFLNQINDVSSRTYSEKGDSGGSELKNLLKAKVPIWTETIKAVRKKHGKTKIGEITVNQLYGGMRGMYGLIWEISDLDPEKGISFRGLTIDECRFILPKLDGTMEPMIEGFLWFLLTGEIPTLEQAKGLACELAERAKKFPKPILKFLDCCDKCWHPMSTLSVLMNALSNHSKFREAYMKGMPKTQNWEHMYEDCMDLVAFTPLVGGLIYRQKLMEGKKEYKWSDQGDLATNFANLLDKGDDKNFIDYIRLYMIVHSDHEGGNVCAHTMHLVSSALSDPFKSFAAAMCGLAGPLHGLASQICLKWLQELQAKHGESPTPENVTSFVEETFKSGKVVPGYGHAVLRKTDPRFLTQLNFAKEHKIEDSLIKLAETVSKVVPPILEKGGKVKNPWPNIDAVSGSVLQHFCIQDVDFYTVFFGIGRSLGLASSNVWTSAMLHPIERPKSISTCNLRKKLSEMEKKKGKC